MDLSADLYDGVYNTGTAGVTPHMWEIRADRLWPNITAVMPVAFISHIPPPPESGTVTVFCLTHSTELNSTQLNSTELNRGIFITEVTQRPSAKGVHSAAILVSLPRSVFSIKSSLQL